MQHPSKIIVFILFIFFATNVFSQTSPLQTVRGRIVNKATLEPLQFVTVTVISNDNQLNGITDSSGRFAIEKVPVGRCQIIATSIGYTEFAASGILVYSGKETILEIGLEEKITELSEAVVKSKVNKYQPINKFAIVSSRMLSAEEASRYAGSWGDPARMAANLAGVASANDSRNDIVIRGNSPMGLLWRLDGFEIPNPNHFGAMGGTGGPIGMINNNQLTNSDFYTGAFPAEFGNVTSGVFDLKLRNGNNRKQEFMASMGFNGFEAGAEGYLKKGKDASYMINARYSFLGILKAMGVDFGTNGAVPEYQDVCAKVNLPLKKGNLSFITLLGASHIKMNDDMNDENNWSLGDYGSDVETKNKQVFIGANYVHRFSAATRLENRLSYQNFDATVAVDKIGFQYSSRKDDFDGNNGERRIAWVSSLHHRINAKDFVNVGIGADYLMTDIKDILHHSDATSSLLHDANKNSSLFKAYGQWQHRFNDDITLIPGVYGHYYTLTKESSIEPRLALQWKTSPEFTVNLGTGLYSQLQPRLVYFYKENNAYANDNLKMTHGWQNVAGFNWKMASALRLKAEVYYQYLYKVPVISNIPQQSILNFGDDYYNDWDYAFINKGTGMNYGIDVTLEKFFEKKYYFLVTGSLYNSKYKGYDNITRNSKFNGNFALNVLGGYEWNIGKRSLFSLNMKIAWMGGKRYIPVKYRSSDDSLTYDYTKTYTQKNANYFKMDLNLSMKTNYKHLSTEWFIEVTNFTNRKNIWTKYYDVNHKEERFFYQMGLMPVGGFKIYF